MTNKRDTRAKNEASDAPGGTAGRQRTARAARPADDTNAANAIDGDLVDPRLGIAAVMLAWRGLWQPPSGTEIYGYWKTLEPRLFTRMACHFTPKGQPLQPVTLAAIDNYFCRSVLPAEAELLRLAHLERLPDQQGPGGQILSLSNGLCLEPAFCWLLLRPGPQEEEIFLPDDLWEAEPDTPLEPWRKETGGYSRFCGPSSPPVAPHNGNPFAAALARAYALVAMGRTYGLSGMVIRGYTSFRIQNAIYSYSKFFRSMFDQIPPTLALFAGTMCLPRLHHSWQADDNPPWEFFANANRLLTLGSSNVVLAMRQAMLVWYYCDAERYRLRSHVNASPSEAAGFRFYRHASPGAAASNGLFMAMVRWKCTQAPEDPRPALPAEARPGLEAAATGNAVAREERRTGGQHNDDDPIELAVDDDIGDEDEDWDDLPEEGTDDEPDDGDDPVKEKGEKLVELTCYGDSPGGSAWLAAYRYRDKYYFVCDYCDTQGPFDTLQDVLSIEDFCWPSKLFQELECVAELEGNPVIFKLAYLRAGKPGREIKLNGVTHVRLKGGILARRDPDTDALTEVYRAPAGEA